MVARQSISVSLPVSMVDEIDSRLRSGQYGSVDEAVAKGLKTLFDQDDRLDDWLRNEIVAGHREYMADPSKGLSADEILARVNARATGRP